MLTLLSPSGRLCLLLARPGQCPVSACGAGCQPWALRADARVPPPAHVCECL